jgi:hypothetical protein
MIQNIYSIKWYSTTRGLIEEDLKLRHICVVVHLRKPYHPSFKYSTVSENIVNHVKMIFQCSQIEEGM